MKFSFSTPIILTILMGWAGFIATNTPSVNAQEPSTCFMITQTGRTVDLSTICGQRHSEKLSRQQNQQEPSLLAAMGRGIALSLQGEWQQAEQAFRQAIALNPSYPDAYDSLGNVLVERGRLPEALRAYRRAIELRPQEGVLSANAYNNLGFTLIQIGETRQGMSALCKSLQLDPNFQNPRENLLYFISRMGRKIQDEELLTFCQNSVQIN